MRNKIVITPRQQLDFELQSAVLRTPTDIPWRRHICRLLLEAGAPIEECDFHPTGFVVIEEGWTVHSQVNHETKDIEISWEYRDSSLPPAPSHIGFFAFLFVCAVMALGLYLGTIWTLTSQ